MCKNGKVVDTGKRTVWRAAQQDSSLSGMKVGTVTKEEQLISAFRKIQKLLEHAEPKQRSTITTYGTNGEMGCDKHLAFLCEEGLALVEKYRLVVHYSSNSPDVIKDHAHLLEKANRRLGFIQGMLFHVGRWTIEDLQAMRD